MNKITDSLVIIPARGGSKGVPRKNIRLLNGRPLIHYTIDAARGVTDDDNICVSTEDTEIKQIVESVGLRVPFLRPVELATDTAGTYEVLLHALEYYEKEQGRKYDKVILLQPTSPLRNAQHIKKAYENWQDTFDMVVSVKESKVNPYFNLFEEDRKGFLMQSKQNNYTRRQDCPKVWEYNGAIYIIKVESLKKMPLDKFRKIKKFEMDEMSSHDIDTELDFKIVEMLQKNYK
jgi:CMP-N,N'-diacetyllegionaminic acid synthase